MKTAVIILSVATAVLLLAVVAVVFMFGTPQAPAPAVAQQNAPGRHAAPGHAAPAQAQGEDGRRRAGAQAGPQLAAWRSRSRAACVTATTPSSSKSTASTA